MFQVIIRRYSLLILLIAAGVISVSLFQPAPVKANADPEFPHIDFPLTEEERQWLRTHKSVKCPSARFFQLAPIYMNDEKGDFVGMGVDLAEYIADRLGLEIQWQLYDDINGTIGSLIRHESDFVSFMGENIPGYGESWTLTNFFQEFPSMIVVPKATQGRVTMDDLKRKRVACVRLWPEYGYILESYPEIDVTPVKYVEDGLKAVAFGEVDAFICILPVVAYQIQDMGITTLRIAGQMDKVFQPGCGVRSDMPELHSLINKVLATMPEAEKAALMSKWIPVMVPDGIDYERIMKWAVPVGCSVLIILTAFAYWNRKLSLAYEAERESRRQATKAKEKMEQAVLEEQELRKKQVRFIDMLSHEYRTPAAVIQANLDLMEMKFLEGEEAMAPHLDKMQKAIGRLTELFSAGLDKGDMKGGRVSLNRQVLELRTVFQAAAEHIQAMWPQREIYVYVDENLQNTDVQGDPILIKTVMLNLMENALKYSSEDTPAFFRLEGADGSVIIRIKDNGVGIPEKDLDRIFEKYYRADSGTETSGTGVGLFLVKRTVDLHGGSVDVSSRANAGTTFTVTLPRYQDVNDSSTH